jgi:Heterokaryon incompatibility protein (HET)
LSINQNNPIERSQKVLVMRQIYSAAFKVLVWLGQPSQYTELASAKMRAVEAYFYLVSQRQEQRGSKNDPALDVGRPGFLDIFSIDKYEPLRD